VCFSKVIVGPDDCLLSDEATYLMCASAKFLVGAGGFLLFYEATNLLPAIVWGLDESAWATCDLRDYARWLSVDSWKQRLRSSGFTCVTLLRSVTSASAFASMIMNLVVLNHVHLSLFPTDKEQRAKDCMNELLHQFLLAVRHCLQNWGLFP
jgi:hypothetical protein